MKVCVTACLLQTTEHSHPMVGTVLSNPKAVFKANVSNLLCNGYMVVSCLTKASFNSPLGRWMRLPEQAKRGGRRSSFPGERQTHTCGDNWDLLTPKHKHIQRHTHRPTCLIFLISRKLHTLHIHALGGSRTDTSSGTYFLICSRCCQKCSEQLEA